MAKFTGKNIEFKDGQKAIFGDSDDSYIAWDGSAAELIISTVVSGVDPTNAGHLTTKQYVDVAITTATGSLTQDHTELLNIGTNTHPQLDIFKADSIQMRTDEKEPTGFVNRTDSTLHWDDGSRTLTVSGTFSYYIHGVRYDITGPKSKQITDTEGMWYFYFDSSEVLQTTQTITTAAFTDNALVSFVYWQATENEVIY